MNNKLCRYCGYYISTGGVYSKDITIGWCNLYKSSTISNSISCSRYRNDYEELLERKQSISLIIGLLINRQKKEL